MEKYILAIGELLIDGISTTTVSSLSEAIALNIHPGGSPGNFCRYIKRCGTPVEIVAAVGTDGLGKILLEKVKEEGISTQYIHQLPNHNTSFIVVARTSGTPEFIPYRDADKYITTVDVNLIANAAMIHTTAFALSKEPARSSILNAFKIATNLQIPVSVDWNFAQKIWGNDNDAVAVFTQLQQYRPLFKFSIDDIERFTETKRNIKDTLAYLDGISATAICLTCGSDGVYYKSDDTTWHHMPAQKIEVKNVTGAGDAFWAGFISANNKGLNMHESVSRGIQVASMKLQGKWEALKSI